MGLPLRNKRRRKPILTELESQLPPPDFNTVAKRIGHDWQNGHVPLERSPSGTNPSEGPTKDGVMVSLARTEKQPSKHLSAAYDFTQAGQKRVEIIPQRPPRPEGNNIPDGINDFRSILVESPVPAPIQAPPPVNKSNSRHSPSGYSPTQSTYSMPSPSVSAYRSPLSSPKLQTEQPPPISPKSPLRNKQRFLPAPRSPPPSSPPPPIPAFPQAALQPPLPIHPGSTYTSSNTSSVYTSRQEISYPDSHYFRQSISSTNGSTSDRPISDVLDTSTNITLIRDSERMDTPSSPGSIKRKSSKRSQKSKQQAPVGRLGHRRNKTEGEIPDISIPSTGSATVKQGNASPSKSEDSRESKASSMVLQGASGWDPSSSSEDESVRRGGKGRKKKRKDKVKEKEGKNGKSR